MSFSPGTRLRTYPLPAPLGPRREGAPGALTVPGPELPATRPLCKPPIPTARARAVRPGAPCPATLRPGPECPSLSPLRAGGRGGGDARPASLRSAGQTRSSPRCSARPRSGTERLRLPRDHRPTAARGCCSTSTHPSPEPAQVTRAPCLQWGLSLSLFFPVHHPFALHRAPSFGPLPPETILARRRGYKMAVRCQAWGKVFDLRAETGLSPVSGVAAGNVQDRFKTR